LSDAAIVDFAPPGGPQSRRMRLRVSWPSAADSKYPASFSSTGSRPNSSSAKKPYEVASSRPDPGVTPCAAIMSYTRWYELDAIVG